MQGDFVAALIDGVNQDLGRDVRDISVYSLNSALDTAVRGRHLRSMMTQTSLHGCRFVSRRVSGQRLVGSQPCHCLKLIVKRVM